MKNRVIYVVAIVIVIVLLILRLGYDETPIEEVSPTPEIVEVEPEPEVVTPTVPEVEVVIPTTPASNTYRVTAYCACAKCCGEWATKRPLDENGEPIVYGAAGVELTSGVSCASPLPFGTQIELDGFGTVEVHDRTAKWIVEKHGKNIIDVYIDNHEEALNFGVKHLEGRVLE